MNEHIITGVSGGIMRIEIHRPQKRNALNFAMYTALSDALERGDADPAVRVMLICGQPGLFCAGNDIQDFLDPLTLSPDSPVLSFMQAIARVTKPIVAAVGGNAVGVGTTMLLHCDLVYAAESARFRLPFVPLGICPEFGVSLLLPKRVGHQRAAELLFFGEPFDARYAHEIGLVNAVCSEADLMTLAIARARELAERPQDALRLAKRLLKVHDAALTQQVMADEMKHFVERVQTPEARDAFLRFVESGRPQAAPSAAPLQQ